jgi:hypothetical protein
MDSTTLLIIIILLIVFGGGGWYGRGRWFRRVRKQFLRVSLRKHP